MTTDKKKAAAKRLDDRYKRHGTNQRGSPEQWARIAQIVALKGGNALAILGLTKLPSSVDELRQARRKAMALAHPDKGHEAERAIRINDAFQQVLKLLESKAPPTAQAKPMPMGLQHPARCEGTLPLDLDSPLWEFELKRDGERFLFYLGFNPYAQTARNTLLSRTLSKVDGNYVDRTANVPHLSDRDYGLNGTILDGEMFHTDLNTTQSIMSSSPEVSHGKQRDLGRITYHVFDILFLKGEDVRMKPLRERRQLLLEVVRLMDNPYIKVVEQRPASEAQSWFAEVVAAGGEGLVGKRLDAPYGVDWAKWKKAIDVSCIITGWKPGKDGLKGKLGSIQVSVYQNGKLKVLGYVSGMNVRTRDDMTRNFDRNWMGKVIDVFAMELTKTGKFREASFHRPRPDILPEQCTLEKLLEDAKRVVSRTKQ